MSTICNPTYPIKKAMLNAIELLGRKNSAIRGVMYPEVIHPLIT